MLRQHQDSLLPRFAQGEEGHETTGKRPYLVRINRVLHVVDIHTPDNGLLRTLKKRLLFMKRKRSRTVNNSDKNISIMTICTPKLIHEQMFKGDIK